MKKIVSTVAALGLVAGLATTASALDLSVSGSYQLIGASQSDGLGAGNGVALTGTTDNGSDAFYFHSFVMNPTLKINDNITMKADIRLADRDVWGLDDAANTVGGTMTNAGNSTGRVIDVRQIYMEYMSPIGKFRVGRVPTSAWGGKFVDSASQGNRIMWWPSFVGEPFSLLLFTQKMVENDAAIPGAGSDQDQDGYYIGLGHKGQMGSTDAAWFQTRNTTVAANPEGTVQNNLWYYGNYKINNFSIDAEVAYVFGDSGAFTGTNQGDRDALAAELDVTANFGDLNVGALYFYTSGDDKVDNDRESYGATGNDFNPYLILTGDWTAIMNTDKAASAFSNAITGVNGAGVSSFGVHAGYQVSPQLSLAGAIGGAWANEAPAGVDDSYGIEYDLNAFYKLMDNLTYSVHFGYLDTGDFFKGGVAATTLNSITFMAHAITMTF